ncbi:tRNA pseudouridine(55) synthase TruB [Syntrophus aciditrophicus]|uniref:tRNA pseudouridine synthase B n=1 Tax=Syntrophus aciditrophicus (strain SB) TaxID=56780 RepID=TRUB_SYNAS|nr:tRNA pseudouridine(55) synthase TruB [Syntrophus aciditrophicus]Q2LWU1.1 RecName: Full=tRNA pseudouridine synthase B; AltName: Full=tRNA pseudouridine(55) synthase; Short=Psi55 synthase; AltName: Full=tRNA pseudouridylate synthase; AltName: Full=tRNA-uridine isomerase [Syntrophus aciditrophicus SB]ABC78551.1 tRNA pseudouridine synthase B [Syntrophus aciditrophicus SB]
MDGILILDKSPGKTSQKVVQEVKRILGVRKAGHAGTLDPLATGVLPLCLNEATKLVQFLSLDDKEYRATMLLGVTTETMDIEGRITDRREPEVDEVRIREALQFFTGPISQEPPRYSAVKFKGRPLYSWARKGVDIALPPRTVQVYSSILEEIALPYVTFRVACSKGTYIRTLCADLGERLGCGACMSVLRRLRCGCFTLETAVSLEDIADGKGRETLLSRVIPLSDGLRNVAAIEISEELSGRIRDGFQPDGSTLREYHIPSLADGDMVKFLTSSGGLVAVARFLYASDQLAVSDMGQPAVRILRVFHDRA